MSHATYVLTLVTWWCWPAFRATSLVNEHLHWVYTRRVFQWVAVFVCQFHSRANVRAYNYRKPTWQPKHLLRMGPPHRRIYQYSIINHRKPVYQETSSSSRTWFFHRSFLLQGPQILSFRRGNVFGFVGKLDAILLRTIDCCRSRRSWKYRILPCGYNQWAFHARENNTWNHRRSSWSFQCLYSLCH